MRYLHYSGVSAAHGHHGRLGGIASAVMRVNTIFSSLPWDNIVTHYSQHYTDLRYVHDFYSKWGPLIVTSYFLSVPVQIIVVCLPFLMSSFPFQKQFYPLSQEVATPNTNESQPIEQPECPEKADNSERRKQQHVRMKTECRQQNMPEYIHNTVQSTVLPPSRRQFATLEERPIIQLQQMNNMNRPVERNARYCPSQINYGQRMISAGKAVIETMNRAYHVHNSERPLWNLLERPTIPHPRLEARDCLAGGVRIFNPANYLNMAYSSPPPPYSLHPQLESQHRQHQYLQQQYRNRQVELDTSSYVSADPDQDYLDIHLANDQIFVHHGDHSSIQHGENDVQFDNCMVEEAIINYPNQEDDQHYYKNYQEWSERSLII